MCFYFTAQLGEFTIPTLNAFNPDIYVKLSNVSLLVDRARQLMTVFFLPRTKIAVHSEAVAWSKQNNASDLKKVLERHLKLNKPPSKRPLFAYKNNKGKHMVLTKKIFLK